MSYRSRDLHVGSNEVCSRAFLIPKHKSHGKKLSQRLWLTVVVTLLLNDFETKRRSSYFSLFYKLFLFLFSNSISNSELALLENLMSGQAFDSKLLMYMLNKLMLMLNKLMLMLNKLMLMLNKVMLNKLCFC